MWGETSAQEIEIANLKKKNFALDSELVNEKNKNAHVTKELEELKRVHKDAVYRVEVQTERALKAEESLRRKTEEWKLSEVQKSNLETALSQEREKLTSETTENKRLNYELETSSARSSNTAGQAQVKLQAEKIALEQQVSKLQSELDKIGSELEREKAHSGGATAFGGNDRHRASAAHELANRCSTLEAENARLIASTKSAHPRPSLTPSDLPQRNRFGYSGTPASSSNTANSSQSTRRTSIAPSDRPASSLGNHPSSSIPLSASARRRSSSLAPIPLLLPDVSGRISQLERELGAAHTKVDVVEKELGNLKVKLGNKERELLKVENELMALSRSKGEEGEKLLSKVEDSRDELECTKAEVVQVREVMRKEIDKLVKDFKGERSDLEAKVERMKNALEKKEEEIERCEIRREEVEMELEKARKEDLISKGKGIKAVEEVLRERDELERALSSVRAELKTERGKESERERLETALRKERDRIGEEKAKHQRAIEELLREKEELAKKVEASEELLRQQQSELDAALRSLESSASPEVEGGEAVLLIAQKELEVTRLQRDSLQVEVETFRTQQSSADVALVELRTQIVEKDDHLSRLSAERDELLSAHQGEVQTLQHAAMRLEEAKSLLESKTEALEAGQQTLALAVESAEDVSRALEAERDGLLEELVAAEEKLATLGADKLDLVAQITTTSDRVAELEASLVNLTATTETLDQLRADHVDLTNLVASLRQQLDSTTDSLSQSQATIVTLEASLAETASKQLEIDHLRSQLVDAESLLEELRQQVTDLEGAEWVATETTTAAESRALLLETRILELQASFASANEANEAEALLMRADLGAKLESLEAAAERLSELETQLEMAIQSQNEVESLREEVQRRTRDSQQAQDRLAVVEAELNTAATELDRLQSSSEDAAAGALKDAGELHERIAEQDSHLELLRGEVVGLRTTLIRSEAQLVELNSQLTTARANATSADAEKSQCIQELVARIEASDNQLLQLRSELQDAYLRLDESEAQFATIPSSNATSVESSPKSFPSSSISRSSPSSLSADLSQQITLVTRLRQERDELVSRLEFVCVEAKFRVEDFENRLSETRSAPASEVKQMEDRLAGYSDILEEKEKRIIEDGLAIEAAGIEMEALVSSLAATTRNLAEKEQRLIVFEEEAKRVEGLEARIHELEQEITELNARVLRRTEQIGQGEQTIARLTCQLAMNTPLGEGDDDTVELSSPPTNNTDSSLRRQELDSTSQALVDHQLERQRLESQLGLTTSELRVAISQIEENQRISESLQEELDLNRAELSRVQAALSRQDLLVVDVDALRTERDSLLVSVETVSKSLTENGILHSSEVKGLSLELTLLADQHSASLEKIIALESTRGNDLEDANRVVELESRLAQFTSLYNNASSKIDSLSLVESELRQSVQELQKQIDVSESTMLSLRQATQEQAQALEASATQQSSLESELKTLESSRAAEVNKLSSELAAVQGERTRIVAELERLEKEVVTKDQELAELERRYTATASSLETAHQATTDLSKRLQTTEEHLAAQEDFVKDSAGTIADLEHQLEVAISSRDASESRLAAVEELYHSAATEVSSERVARQASELQLEELRAATASSVEDLADAQNTVRRLESELDSVSRDRQAAIVDVELLQTQLVQTQQQIEKLVETSKSEKAAGKREIQTLRLLGRKADGAVEELSGNLARAQALLDQSRGELLGKIPAPPAPNQSSKRTNADLLLFTAVQHEKETNIRELLENLELLEIAKADVDERVLFLSREMEGREALISELTDRLREHEPMVSRVKELEKRLEDKLAEVDETEEKYLEVLRVQKRHLAKIERMTVKIESLQRDLVSSVRESSRPTPTSPAHSSATPAVTPASTLKKRERPSEFDAAPLPPRAVVISAPTPIVPSRSQENLAVHPSTLDSNTGASRRSPIKKRSSKKEMSKVVDGVVPLKAAGPSSPVAKRSVLSERENNGVDNLSAVPLSGLKGEKSKGELLRDRLASMRLKKDTPSGAS